MTRELELHMIDMGFLEPSVREELEAIPDVQHVYEDERFLDIGPY
jgi:hypothetical protein